MQTETPKFHAWLDAEKDAQAAERELHAVMLQFAFSATNPPLEALVLSVRAKRARAHQLFDEAMQELKVLADSLRYQQVLTSGATRANALGSRDQHGDESGDLYWKTQRSE